MKKISILIAILISVFCANFFYTSKSKSKFVKYDAKKPANAGCVIFDKNYRILFSIMSKDGKIAIPGGTSEVGESAMETAKRETFEEIGTSVEVFNPIKISENGFVYFLCKLNGKVDHGHKFLEEISGNKWFDFNLEDDSSLRFKDEYLEIFNIIKTNDFEEYVS